LGTEYFTRVTNLAVPLITGQVINQTYTLNVINQNGTAYVDNKEYNTFNGNSSLTALQRIYNSEGFVDTISATIPNYKYYRRDHLGNNREVWVANTKKTLQRTQYYPSGLPWASNTGDNPGQQERKYNGKEFVEMHGYDTYDYGARGYYPAMGRFTSVDPLAEKYYSISPYVYCGGNPENRTDPDGRYFKIAKNSRKETLQYINSRAAGTFGINKRGNLYVIKMEGSSGFSTYYRDKLISAINDKKDVIKISKGTSFTNQNGEVKNVDKDAGGGVTIDKTITKTDGTKTKEADVIVSGNKQEGLCDTKGNDLRDDPADILMHELVGHALPWTVGPDTGNAVDNENKARIQLKEGKNQEREKDPNHPE